MAEALHRIIHIGSAISSSAAIKDLPAQEREVVQKITAGAGCGIIDDMSSDELLEVIKEIDRNGSSSFYYEAKRPDVVWDHRKYDMPSDNLLLKGEIEQIAEGYSAFEAYL